MKTELLENCFFHAKRNKSKLYFYNNNYYYMPNSVVKCTKLLRGNLYNLTVYKWYLKKMEPYKYQF